MDKPSDFGLTELQLEIKNTCREIGEKKIVPVREKYDAEGIFPRDIAKEFADAGLFGLFIPEQYGGMGGNTMDMVVAVEELSKYCAGIALSLFGTALGTLPIHIQLFDALGFKRPKYLHTAQLMKLDGVSKRKLSKRKDPEFALDYYFETGIPIPAAIEYVMTLLNSNFEEWRRANQSAPLDDFKFTAKKMSSSGALFDLDKLSDVCKNVVARMSADEVYAYTSAWAKEYDPEFYELLTRDEAYSKAILSIGRGGKKPRKDFGRWNEVKQYLSFFFDELFEPNYSEMPALDHDLIVKIAHDYAAVCEKSEAQDANAWFEEIKSLCPAYGLASDMKAYKQDPDAYKGNVGDFSMVLRVAVCGRSQAPDLFQVMQLLGKERVIERLGQVK